MSDKYEWTLTVGLQRKRKGYNPEQPRVPGGQSGGGRWTSGSVANFNGAARAGKLNADKWRQAGEFERELTQQQRDDFLEYTATQYKSINAMLRHPENFGEDAYTQRLQERADRLTDVLDKTEIPEDVIVWRGAKFPDSMFQSGVEFQDEGFVSTSLYQQIGTSFVENRRSQPGHSWALAEILVPKGTRGAYIRSLSNTPGDAEILLQKGLTFRVVDIVKGDKHPVVRLVVTGASAQKSIKLFDASASLADTDKFTWLLGDDVEKWEAD